ncbi:hypothetical protein CLORY_34790 [Clostridium oryzae]|uniref:Uncharacterized protein n=1 Tax=Clostridium oryzae TaxID=1450648 RepID=A0A1V4IGU5_9CLOT|nr:hypothetical protein CLORY_34790 [Clostridium oryzae]
MLLSDPIKNSIKPSITFNGQFIYVLWEYENNIEYLSTDMSGTKILNRNIFTKSAEKDTFKSIYLSSHPYDIGNKSNYSILSATDNPLFILDIKNKQTKETKNYAVIDDTKKNTNFLLSSSIRHMQLVLIEKDKKLMQIISNYAKLKNGINTIIDGKAKSLLNNKIFVPDTNKTEDELMLGKLNYIINSLSNEIYIRDEKINELNTQINKQLFKKLFH